MVNDSERGYYAALHAPGSRKGVADAGAFLVGTESVRRQHGFTLIEPALVLVIVGLALGGILKGQELITAARVRNIATQLNGVKLAYLGFKDRYRQFPGDLPDDIANANIPGNPGGCGPTTHVPVFCGNGVIDPAENLVVWAQLSRANFIIGTYTGVAGPPPPLTLSPPRGTNPAQPFFADPL